MGIASRAPLAALSLLPLYVGVATVRCVQSWGVPAQVKWPNDIWVEGAKLAGILVETAPMPAQQATAVVIGLGLNWTAAPQVAGKAVTCVADCIATRPAPEQAAQDLIMALYRAYEDCIHGAPLGFAAFDALQGLTIRTDAGQEGRAVGLNAQGHLGLQTPQAVHWLHSGEVSVALKNE
jgi:BirA family transcriptional regulator, biotin operon repressor / biotin---[acetyl-CoA-carboxylase] ligase